MDAQRHYEEQPPLGIPGVAAIQRAAEKRERILAQITADCEARRIARIRELKLRWQAVGETDARDS